MLGNRVALLVFLYIRTVVADEAVTTVKISDGQVIGNIKKYDGKTVHVFKGIPYAEPPVGELRFAPPQQPKPWTKPRECFSYGNRCMADKALDYMLYYHTRTIPNMSEDCLYINVASPFPSRDSKRPVMVYIHGGRLMHGSGSDFEPEALAVAAGVVHVTFNYRLNVFGFLATNDKSAPGNVGMLDQVMALKWVKDNIESFGGDPDRVTISGYDGGAWSVSAHMVSPLSQGLFFRAISQSGSLYGYNLETQEERAVRTEDLAKTLECNTDTEGPMLECLRKLPAETISQAVIAKRYMPISCVTVGDDFLPTFLTELYDDYKIHEGVDYLFGKTSEEGTFIADLLGVVAEGSIALMTRGAEEGVQDYATNVVIKEVLRLPEGRDRDAIQRLVNLTYFADVADNVERMKAVFNMTADVLITGPMFGAASRVDEAGNKAYFYEIDHTSKKGLPIPMIQFHLEGNSAPELNIRTAHGLDQFYSLGYPVVKDVPMSLADVATEADKNITNFMMHAWSSFAEGGEPSYMPATDLGEAIWPEYNALLDLLVLWKNPMSHFSFLPRPRKAETDIWGKLIPSLVKWKAAEESRLKDSEPSQIPKTKVVKDEL